MPTLRDVAERAGVTITTVSRMLNGRVNVSDKTRGRIEEAMRELGYHPNEMARALAKKSSNLIGLLVPSVKQYFFAELIQEVENAVAARGCQLLLCVSDQDFGKERAYYQMLLGDRVRGIIVASYSQHFDQIAHSGAPVFYIERRSGDGTPSAVMDSFQGGRLAGEHLAGKGCRNLLYLSGNAAKNSVSKERYDGFCAAAKAAGLEKPALAEAQWQEFVSLDYTDTIRRIFEQFPETDGILTSNDLMAATVLRWCVGNRIPVPEKLKIVGYDDTAFASLCPVPLTTIHQPITEIARYAVDSVIRRSEGETVPVNTVFPVRLVERETT
ncbi:MAG: LacI family DNA-binding transcriptional regulator [Clostridia bacterium]|nr:LacI family DNA-binding transcriptional regulator [Clostridia bacterium]MBQ6722345.1 LacI family DNA-binding transcriptional regulator [Clostridia bacterium]